MTIIGIAMVILLCGSLTSRENKAYAQSQQSCPVGQYASPVGVCCPVGKEAVHLSCMTPQQARAREEKNGKRLSNCNSAIGEVLLGNPSAAFGCIPKEYNPLSGVSDYLGLLSGKPPTLKTLPKIAGNYIKNQVVDAIKNQVIDQALTPPSQTTFELCAQDPNTAGCNTSPPPTDNTNKPTTQSQQQVDCTASPNDPSCPSTSSLQSLCPDGSQPNAAGNCLTATSPPDNLQAQPPATTCPDGSTPAADRTCPPPPSQQQQQPPTCPDGSQPNAAGNCPSPPTPTQSLCPDGSTPAADGTCPSSPQQTTPPTSPYSWYDSHQLQKST